MQKNPTYVKCSKCKNRRLFDVISQGTGIIAIKCPKCSNVVVVNLQEKK